MRTVRVVVTGRVQGVGFRWFTRDLATSHGVAGWVRNLPDGSVEALLHGADLAVQAVISGMRRGPEGAHVEDARVLESSSPTELEASSTFEIRRA